MAVPAPILIIAVATLTIAAGLSVSYFLFQRFKRSQLPPTTTTVADVELGPVQGAIRDRELPVLPDPFADPKTESDTVTKGETMEQMSDKESVVPELEGELGAVGKEGRRERESWVTARTVGPGDSVSQRRLTVA